MPLLEIPVITPHTGMTIIVFLAILLCLTVIVSAFKCRSLSCTNQCLRDKINSLENSIRQTSRDYDYLKRLNQQNTSIIEREQEAKMCRKSTYAPYADPTSTSVSVIRSCSVDGYSTLVHIKEFDGIDKDLNLLRAEELCQILNAKKRQKRPRL